MPRNQNKRQRAGAVRMPSEYFGVDSGKYTTDALAGQCDHAFGKAYAVSQGMQNPGGSYGPNLGAYPNGNGTQTGGRRRRSRSRKNKSQKRKRVNKSKRSVKKTRSKAKRSRSRSKSRSKRSRR
jgi:hypothetical protein